MWHAGGGDVGTAPWDVTRRHRGGALAIAGALVVGLLVAGCDVVAPIGLLPSGVPGTGPASQAPPIVESSVPAVIATASPSPTASPAPLDVATTAAEGLGLVDPNVKVAFESSDWILLAASPPKAKWAGEAAIVLVVRGPDGWKAYTRRDGKAFCRALSTAPEGLLPASARDYFWECR
jgi:hypothetical protein